MPVVGERSSVQQLIIKDRFPAYRHVQDPAIDQLALAIDTLYRQHRTELLADLSTRTLDLFNDPMSGSDHESIRALSIAVMKVNGAVTIEQGIRSSVGFLSKVLFHWDKRWPPPDSLGMEFLTLKAKALHVQGGDICEELEACRCALARDRLHTPGQRCP